MCVTRGREQLPTADLTQETEQDARSERSDERRGTDLLRAGGTELHEDHRNSGVPHGRVGSARRWTYPIRCSIAGEMNPKRNTQLPRLPAGVRSAVQSGRAQEDDAGKTPPHEPCRVVHNLAELVAGSERFRCIYADPPWAYENTACRGAAAKHYRTMGVEEVCRLPVRDLADGEAHLHLWTTSSFLFEAKQVIDAWGFQFKSSFVWCKPVLGCGNYWRLAHEFLLLGVRGRLPFADRTLRSWTEAARTSHSTKPDRIRRLVERASPGPRLELFGRRACPGWTVFGTEIQRMLL
jgi:N6-adenosine-specific RNA methylase IME4